MRSTEIERIMLLPMVSQVDNMHFTASAVPRIEMSGEATSNEDWSVGIVRTKSELVEIMMLLSPRWARSRGCEVGSNQSDEALARDLATSQFNSLVGVPPWD